MSLQVAPCPQKYPCMYKLCPTKLSCIQWHFLSYFKTNDWIQIDRLLYILYVKNVIDAFLRIEHFAFEYNWTQSNTNQLLRCGCYFECEYSVYDCSRETSNTVHRLLVSAFLGNVQRKYPPNKHSRWTQPYVNFNVHEKMIKFSI